jgi:4'-phosphopantetheinyl transferase EntD
VVGQMEAVEPRRLTAAGQSQIRTGFPIKSGVSRTPAWPRLSREIDRLSMWPRAVPSRAWLCRRTPGSSFSVAGRFVLRVTLHRVDQRQRPGCHGQ